MLSSTLEARIALRVNIHITDFRADVQSGKVVTRGFPAPDFRKAAIGMQQDFAAAQPSIVIISHCATMGTSVVDNKIIAYLDPGQLPVDGEFIVVFAERSSYVVNMVQFPAFFAQYRDVVICAIHGRTD